MKKTLSFVLALLMILSVTAFAADEEESVTPEPGAHWEQVSSGAKYIKSKYGSPWVHAWVEIKNTGDVPLFLGSSTLEILSGEDHHEQNLKSVSAFPQVLMPGETGVYDECTMADADLPSKGLKVSAEPEISEASVPCVRYDVTGVKVKTDKNKQTKASGKIVNNTDALADGLTYVGVLCYNKDGKYMGLLYTIITDDINSGEDLSFKTMAANWKVKAEDVKKTVAYAFKNQFQF